MARPDAPVVAGKGFSEVHPPCGVLSCCQRKGFEYCFECEEFPCKKYDGADDTDSFVTHMNQFRDMEKAKLMGMDAYAAELNEKVKLLKILLKSYDNGRRKSFYCAAVNLLDFQDVKAVMKQIESEIGTETSLKTKATIAARLFGEMADKREISLKLRK